MKVSAIKPIALAVALATTLPLPSLAFSQVDGQTGQSSFWEDGRDGWFFYETPPEPKPEPQKEPEPEPTPEPAPAPPPEPAPEKSEGPAPLSAEWLRKNLPKYEDAAWDNPTVENIQAYLYLQQYAVDKSNVFADNYQLAVVGDPVLDSTSRRPLSSVPAQRLAERAVRTRDAVVKSISEDVGIFFFYSSTCSQCADMIPVIRSLEEDFALIPISVDGKDLPGNPFPNMRVDQGHAQQIGIPRPPALYLASPDGTFEPISHTALSLDGARDRIVMGAFRQGWIDQQTYESTKPVRNKDISLPRMMSASDMAGLKGNGDSDNFVEPSELLERIKDSKDSYIKGLNQ